MGRMYGVIDDELCRLMACRTRSEVGAGRTAAAERSCHSDSTGENDVRALDAISESTRQEIKTLEQHGRRSAAWRAGIGPIRSMFPITRRSPREKGKTLQLRTFFRKDLFDFGTSIERRHTFGTNRGTSVAHAVAPSGSTGLPL